ncbi:MAG: RagB/SusD family nutrient uptake outer membrane protein [Chitinophagaceae bacterium]|nr:RagB/SusD family nutrient uptake outer membrane protein [Chitinophagaceae bacterium]
MKLINKISISFVLILSGISCSKTLDVDPTSVITTNSFWKTEDDAKGALVGMYIDFRNIAEALFTTGDERSEIYTGGVFGGGTYTLFSNAMTPDAPGHADWYGYYRVINSANLLLKYVPGITFKNEAAKNNMLAQAYAMRAYVYFAMTKTWGDLVIRTEPTESADAEVTQKERSAQVEVFALIKDDIEKSLQLFSDNSIPNLRSMWSKPAVNALKADVYLWTARVMNGGDADFTKALNACTEVQSADVQLLPAFNDLFKYTNKGNKETIMNIHFEELEGGNYFWHMWIIGSAVPANISQQAKDLLLPVGGGQGLMVMSNLVRDQFTKDDSRKYGTYFDVYTFDSGGDSTYYTNVCLKGSGIVTGGNRVFSSDMIVYRLADVLLMKAEAKNGLSMDPSDEINEVRKRAYGADYADHVFVNGSQEDNYDAILKERLFELAFEGKRWWDLLRFNKAFELVPTLQTQTDKQYLKLFPIANSVLSLEPKVKQNPGYQ